MISDHWSQSLLHTWNISPLITLNTLLGWEYRITRRTTNLSRKHLKMIINGLISPVLKHTQRKGWEAMWRKRRKGHRHHGCTRTFPPYTWHRKLALSSKHFKIQNGMYANLNFPPVLVIQGGLYLTLKSIVEIQLQCWKVLIFTILKHFFHPYLNWIAFSLSRPHCHKLSDARWWGSKIDIMLLWTEQPWHWPTEATEKLREGWKGSSIHISRKNNQQQADCADWLWNRQTNGGDKIGNINALFMLYKA